MWVFISLPIDSHCTAVEWPQNMVSDSLLQDTSGVAPKDFHELDKRYTSTAYNYDPSTANRGWWTRLKKKIKDFFRELFLLKDEAQTSRFVDFGIRILGSIIFLLAGYFSYRMLKKGHRTTIFSKASDPLIETANTDLETTQVDDFESLTKTAEAEKKYRLSIRYYYLWVLKMLDQKQMISYDLKKTNTDYQKEIATPKIKTQFTYIAYLYDHIWYGRFVLSEAQFRAAKQAFRSLLKALGS